MKKKDIGQCMYVLGAIILVALISVKFFFRIDLTSEKRYTLTPETKSILKQLHEPVYFDIYLSGDLPAGFRKFRNSIREMLDDFKAYSGSRMSYQFIDPADAENAKTRDEQHAKLEGSGLRPVEINKKNVDGSLFRQIIFPGAILHHKGRQLPVNLLRNSREQSWESNLNSSTEMLEYELVKTIFRLSTDSIEKIAFTAGNGELSRSEIYDIAATEFANYYDVDLKTIDGQPDALDNYKAVIIAKPQQPFNERDKFIIDRYIMQGGRVMWLIDAVDVNADSLFSAGYTLALGLDLNLDDQLFNYGVRVNPDVIQDVVHNDIPVTTGTSQISLAPWLYYPLLAPSQEHVITKNLNPVWLRYANSIDTVGAGKGIKKTVLLQSSPSTRTRAVPFLLSLNEVEHILDPQQFNRPGRIVAILLEGRFPSIYRNRSVRNMFPDLHEKQADISVETKMLVIADGDIVRNDVRNTPQGIAPAYPLGFDRYTQRTFGNKEFLVNSLNYLTDDVGLMNLRNREFRLRLLNKQKVSEEKTKWQIINLVLPIIIILCGGLAHTYRRRRRYGRTTVS